VPGSQDFFKFEGDDFDIGFNAGLRWEITEKWAFGVNYRSATKLNYRGHADVSLPPIVSGRTSSTAEIRFPQFVVVGLSYRPTTNWNFEVNVDWTDWDNLNQIVFTQSPLGPQTFPLNWTSSFMYEFGVTRQLPNGYYVSAGYFYSENTTPTAFYNPIIPDDNLHLGSFGFGRRGQRWSWSVAYHFAMNSTRTVSGSFYTKGPETADGKYDIFNQALTATLRLNF
jgi:long-chain fatty acid transport protein